MFGLQRARSPCLPFPRQPFRVPFVLMRDRREQCDRERVEVKLLQDLGDQVRLLSLLVYAIERVSRGVDRQGWYLDSLALGWNGGDPGRNKETYRLPSAQLLHQPVDLLGVCPPWVEDGFGVVEDNEDLP